VGRAQERFKSQSSGTRRWFPRRVPNKAGVVKDLASGSSVKARRFEPSPALVDTGQLRASITFVKGSKYVDIGTALKYASVHNRGGKTEPIPVSDTVKKNLAKWLSKRSNQRWSSSLGFLLAPSITSLKITVPARPFLVVTKKDLQDIEKLVQKFIKE